MTDTNTSDAPRTDSALAALAVDFAPQLATMAALAQRLTALDALGARGTPSERGLQAAAPRSRTAAASPDVGDVNAPAAGRRAVQTDDRDVPATGQEGIADSLAGRQIEILLRIDENLRRLRQLHETLAERSATFAEPA